MTELDLEAAGADGLVRAEGLSWVALPIEPEVYRMAYDVVSNGVLWFVHHGMYDLPRRPGFDQRFRQAFSGYRRYNQDFAARLVDVADSGATVLVQDYHLALVAPLVASRRPDIALVHFSHTPFGHPSELAVLPGWARRELLTGMASFSACGFHSPQWATNFVRCCQEAGIEAPATFVSPLGPDREELAATAGSAAALAAGSWIDELLNGRKLLLRVDRIEPSKNLVRGFQAFSLLLDTHPQLIGAVTFVALVYPSRESLAAYQGYRLEVETAAEMVNLRHGRPGWKPVELVVGDNFARSVAALERYDVLLVNPIRDGLNLVAKEGPTVNEADGVLVLSDQAGAAHEDAVAKVALTVNPFDIEATAAALWRALSMGPKERRARATALKEAALAYSPETWLADQLEAARQGARSAPDPVT
jgi:trehalose 6-phosphate synthase